MTVFILLIELFQTIFAAMFKLFFLITFLFICHPIQSQSIDNLAQQNFSISIESGVSIAFTDYQTQKIGSAARGAIEYYIYPAAFQRIGLGFMFGFQQLKGEESRTSISTHDGNRE